MSSYISNRQVSRDHAESVSLPLLLSAPQLVMQQRLFNDSFEFGSLLQDSYEIYNPTEQEESYMLMPSGCMTMLFQLHDAASSARLCGPLTTMRQLRIPAGGTLFCVRLRPGCGEWLISGGVSTLTDNTAPLSQYLPGCNYLLDQLRRGESFHERNVLLLRLLNAQDALAYRPAPLLRSCLEMIAESHGQIHVSELAEHAGCSERYLNRIFRDKVGISTKTQCELTQLQYSLHSILTTRPKSLLHTAVACGYFDQAHMNRHYRKFLFCTANDMRSANNRTVPSEEIPFVV